MDTARGPAINLERAPVLAFDVGGTDLKSGIVRPDGKVIGLRRTRTPLSPSDPGDAIVEVIVDLTRSYRQAYPSLPIEAIGLAVPGIVDELTGTGILSSNLGWRDYPFVRRTEAELGMPVAFGHDVGAAGDAEFRLGEARETTNGIFLAIGTGIAGVIYADGVRVRGGGLAGEVGQVPVPAPDGPTGVTILESVASAGAIVNRYNAATGRSVAGAKDVLHAATSGDPAARTVWGQAVEALAFSLAHCVALLGSTTVVIGGGLAQAGDALFDPLNTELRKLLTVHEAPAIVPASLGENAGLIGSALKAFDLLDVMKAGRHDV